MTDHHVVKRPDRIGDGSVVAVDQQRRPFVVFLPVMAGEVDFPDMFEGVGAQIVGGGKSVIGGGDKHVVDVEQQAATGAAHDLGDEIGLGIFRLLEQQVGRGVFQQYGATDGLLHLVDMLADAGQRGGRVGKGEQVVVIDVVVGGPRQVFRHESRLVTRHEGGETVEVIAIDGILAADRHAHAVQRQRMVPANAGQRRVRRTPGAHVVFRVDLEENAGKGVIKDCRKVLRLETGAGEAGDRVFREQGAGVRP